MLEGISKVLTTLNPFPSILQSSTLMKAQGLEQRRGGGYIVIKWAGKVGGEKPIDNFLTQSHAKERNEKHQKRKKERRD